jgi:membrane-associated phospholipid phosphatase
MTRKKWFLGLVSAAVLTVPAAGQTVTPAVPSADTPNYFIPSGHPNSMQGPGGAVIEARPVPQTSPVIDSNLTDSLSLPSDANSFNPSVPWYETDWGVAGIGIVATGATVAFDHGINQYAISKISPKIRRDALHAADILELAPLAFAGATMIQSPVSDPELAHASSIAVTAAAEVTAEAFVLKYAIGRQRPASSSTSPFSFYPFNASKSTFSLGAVFPGEGAQTSSFPSGHTLLAFALITPYAELYHQPILYAIPVAVGIGRVVSPDGHWASDVVGGAFLGWLTADLTRRFFPDSDYGMMIFGDGQQMIVGFNGRF